MLPILVAMAIVLVVALAVVVYAAFPHRGAEIPAAPWLGDVMAKAAGAIPTIEQHAGDADVPGADSAATDPDREPLDEQQTGQHAGQHTEEHRVGFTR